VTPTPVPTTSMNPTQYRPSRRLLALALAASAATAHAAGGHHGVDDAALLDTGACKVETWSTGSHGADTLHAGTGCRVGPVELGVSADHAREDGASATGYALQVKWATEVRDGLSLGLSLAPGWQSHARPRYQGAAVMGLATWQAGETVRLHANVGRFAAHRATGETRGGVSADWTFREGWQAMVERFTSDGGHFARAGLRWTPAGGWIVDASRAVRVSGAGKSSWTLGLTREFD